MQERSSQSSGPEVTDDPVSDVRDVIRAFVQQRKRPKWRQWLGMSAAGLILAPFLFATGMWLHYELLDRPRSLMHSGPLVLGRMTTDIRADTILPTPTE